MQTRQLMLGRRLEGTHETLKVHLHNSLFGQLVGRDLHAELLHRHAQDSHVTHCGIALKLFFLHHSSTTWL